jgi:hypothetical protein
MTLDLRAYFALICLFRHAGILNGFIELIYGGGHFPHTYRSATTAIALTC